MLPTGFFGGPKDDNNNSNVKNNNNESDRKSGEKVATSSGHSVMIRPDGRCFMVPRSDNRTSSVSSSGSPPLDFNEQPVSRTYQYRKVMKPMLERKRRARINRCLDELKELMLTALQAEGENVSKLEKADILELTVRHLHKLRRQRLLGITPESTYVDRFRAGFTHCAAEVSQYLASIIEQQKQHREFPEVVSIDHTSGLKLLQHLGSCIQRIEKNSPSFRSPDDPFVLSPYSTPPSSPSPGAAILVTQDIPSGKNGIHSSVWRPW